MNFFLYLAGLLYRGLILIRKLGYWLRLLKVYKFNTPIISIGNIAVGGAGKTPMVIYLSQLLTQKKIKHVIGSRGYKKKKGGTVIVQDYQKKYINNPALAGDEPVMMTYKLDNVPIVVDNKKRRGIAVAIERFCPQLILLDDGFQSLYLDKKKDCVLIDTSLPIAQYQLLPKGRLREPLLALNRSDVVIFLDRGNVNYSIKKTVIPMLDKKTIPYLDAGINAILYKHNYSAQKLEKHELTQLLNEPLIALSGIGNPKPFLDSVNTFCKNSPGQIRNCSLPDHYDYQKNEVYYWGEVVGGAHSNKVGIITTLKDYIKIIRLDCMKLDEPSLYVIDINVTMENEDKLLELILGEG